MLTAAPPAAAALGHLRLHGHLAFDIQCPVAVASLPLALLPQVGQSMANMHADLVALAKHHGQQPQWSSPRGFQS